MDTTSIASSANLCNVVPLTNPVSIASNQLAGMGIKSHKLTMINYDCQAIASLTT
jgi:hypothetical protein